VLGRLLMELRQEYQEIESGKRQSIEYPKVSHLFLLGKPLEPTLPNLDGASEAQSSMFHSSTTRESKLG
jgi:hypothetical protein